MMVWRAALVAAALAEDSWTPQETALWRWANSQGANVSRIVPTTGVYGRGLAAVDGNQGELLALPRHLILGCEAVAAAAAGLPGVVAFTGCDRGVGRTSMRFAGGFEAWDGNTLVVFLAHERLRGAASNWAPYLASLPATFGTLPPYVLAAAAIGGSAAEAQDAMNAAEAFAGSSLEAVTRREAAKWLYFARLVAAAFVDHAGTEAARALRAVLWAKAVVATRAVHLNGMGRCLVPFWDLVNHGPYTAKREVIEDERFVYVRDGEAGGAELLHDYQLGSQTGGACAWDWLVTFGFVPRAAQHPPVACAIIRIRGRAYELPAEQAALARLDGDDVRCALEGALLALSPEDVLRNRTTWRVAAHVTLLERHALHRALDGTPDIVHGPEDFVAHAVKRAGGTVAEYAGVKARVIHASSRYAPPGTKTGPDGAVAEEMVRHEIHVDGRAEMISYTPCGNVSEAARAFVAAHFADAPLAEQHTHVKRLRPLLATKIDGHACAANRADSSEAWLHEETRVISVIGYSTPTSGHDLVTFTHMMNLEERAKEAAAQFVGVGGLGCAPGDRACLEGIFVRRGRELAEAQRQKMAGEGSFVGEKVGCSLTEVGPSRPVAVALPLEWKRVALTLATRDVADFAASWGRGLLNAGASEFVIAVYDEDVATSLRKVVGADRVAVVAPSTTLAQLAYYARGTGRDVLATGPEAGFRGDPWPVLAQKACGAQILESGFADSTAAAHLADEVRRWSTTHRHNPFLPTGKRAHWRHVVGVVYLRAHDANATFIADAWAAYSSKCAFHAALEAALAKSALAGYDFCGLTVGFATPFRFWMLDVPEQHFRWHSGDWTVESSDAIRLVYPGRLDAAWFENGHLIPPLVDATCRATKREVLRTAGAWFGDSLIEPRPAFVRSPRAPLAQRATFALYATARGQQCRTAYFDHVWTRLEAHAQRASHEDDVAFVVADHDTMMWSWPNPNLGLVGPTSWIRGDRPTCYPWPFTGQLMMAPSLGAADVAAALVDPRQRPPHLFGARTPVDRATHAADALLQPMAGLGSINVPLVVFNFAAPICVVMPGVEINQ